MKLLTREAYHERQTELVDQREEADAAYRRANLEAAIGTGTDAAVLEAKQRLELADDKIKGLESAWVETQRVQAAEVKRACREAHGKLVEDAESLLAEREATIARIEAKALDLGQEIAGYEALTSKLCSAAAKYRPHYRLDGMVAHLVTSQMKTASDAPQRNRSLLPLVVATIEGNQRVLEGCSLSDREPAESSKVLNAVARIAPEREMA